MNVEPIDLRLLATFREIARCGSVGRAARVLGRSQPATSHRLRQLETDLGVALFERIGRRLRLTDVGARLLEHADDVLAHAREVRRAVSQPVAGVEGPVSIGTLPTLASHLLAAPLARFLSRHTDVHLRLRLALGTVLESEVRVGDLDLALIAAARPPDGLDVERVGAIELAAALPPRAAPKTKTLAPRTLARLTYLAWEGLDDPTMHALSQYVSAHRLASHTSPGIPHIETLRELVAAGAGYTIVPAYTLRRDAAAGRIAVRLLRGLSVATPLWLVRRPRRVTPTAVDAACEVVRRAVR